MRSGARHGADLAAGLLAAAAGLGEVLARQADGRLLVVVAAMATCVGLVRVRPGTALVLVWALLLWQVATGVPILLVELAIAAVAFGTARWGSSVVVGAAAASMPLAGLVVLAGGGAGSLREARGSRELADAVYRVGDDLLLGVVLVVLVVLTTPFLAGLALRFLDGARRSRHAQRLAEQDAAAAVAAGEQAREIAALREDQARLARDVHDVVGHSLAVILAQAESGQFLPDDDPARLKTTLAGIAGAARTSLRDVRSVLSDEQPSTPVAGGLVALVDGVRDSGHDVRSTRSGTPRALAPELEAVAYRVLQEMLTNAMRHGRRDRPVVVEHHWPAGSETSLRLVVCSTTAPQPSPGSSGGGSGLSGMRRRVESVGGRLAVDQDPAGARFVVTAWIPVRPVAP